MAWTVPWNLIAINVAGDCSGLSIYTDRYGKKIFYPFSPPKEPPSALQIIQREKFRLAQRSWASLSATEKETLELAVNRTSIPLTGQNLYMSAILRNDPESYETIQRQSGLTLPSLP
jgi:hypothetical protein